MNIQEIYDQALTDPTLLSTINIEELLENIESETTEYLEGKSLKTISKTIRNILESTGYFQNIDSIFDKLIGYRYVERVCEIRPGVYIRWINPDKKRLESGGTVISVKICEKCVQVICKTVIGRHISFRFNECVVFQKLTTEEQLILMAYEHIENI
jgi:hypothetical protein